MNIKRVDEFKDDKEDSKALLEKKAGSEPSGGYPEQEHGHCEEVNKKFVYMNKEAPNF